MSIERTCAGPRRAAQRGLIAAWLVLGPAPLPLHAQADPAPALAFRDLLTADAAGVRTSVKARALSGSRVRLVGFMAKMEVPPKGGFYLTPRPVACDEEGGGTADLPPESVFVVVRSSPGRELPWSPRALEVTGLLEVGNRLGEEPCATPFRLLLDRPQDLPGASEKP